MRVRPRHRWPYWNKKRRRRFSEPFASQALYCVRELAIDMDKVNIHGGAIALGHPLGCTGAKLCATLLAAMRQKGVKYGVESMCIGGGMGAAALFELCD